MTVLEDFKNLRASLERQLKENRYDIRRCQQRYDELLREQKTLVQAIKDLDAEISKLKRKGDA